MSSSGAFNRFILLIRRPRLVDLFKIYLDRIGKEACLVRWCCGFSALLCSGFKVLFLQAFEWWLLDPDGNGGVLLYFPILIRLCEDFSGSVEGCYCLLAFASGLRIFSELESSLALNPVV
ncbi:hypothetical protein CARUB_v10014944mg [Capsella rubella]|uniref:Uncharacterized protein n=1 Tax=Capsella rubella TaxID=81985 RepID=R0G892_9BRAS|nr:hypothetical protein CARUB_v10014944mg [Capsella rubella]